jgi:hypothetical protein
LFHYVCIGNSDDSKRLVTHYQGWVSERHSNET